MYGKCYLLILIASFLVCSVSLWFSIYSFKNVSTLCYDINTCTNIVLCRDVPNDNKKIMCAYGLVFEGHQFDGCGIGCNCNNSSSSLSSSYGTTNCLTSKLLPNCPINGSSCDHHINSRLAERCDIYCFHTVYYITAVISLFVAIMSVVAMIASAGTLYERNNGYTEL